MRHVATLLLGLAPGCLTNALWRAPADARQPELAGEAECRIELTESRDLGLVFSVDPPEKPPKRMGIELGRGRTRLYLRNPYAFSFAGIDVIERRTPLEPARITVKFAQTRTKHGTRRDPALLRVEGRVPGDFASRIEPSEEPAEPRTLDEVRDPDLRIQLGHGIDALVALVDEPGLADVVAWCGVEGPGTDWRGALDLARARGTLGPLEPYRVIVRRWRNGTAECFRLRLADVVLASSMIFAGDRFTWEGLWICSLELPREPETPPVLLPALLRYKEYKQPGKGNDLWWRALLTPAALAADFGIAGVEDWLEDRSCEAVTPKKKRK